MAVLQCSLEKNKDGKENVLSDLYTQENAPNKKKREYEVYERHAKNPTPPSAASSSIPPSARLTRLKDKKDGEVNNSENIKHVDMGDSKNKKSANNRKTPLPQVNHKEKSPAPKEVDSTSCASYNAAQAPQTGSAYSGNALASIYERIGPPNKPPTPQKAPNKATTRQNETSTVQEKRQPEVVPDDKKVKKFEQTEQIITGNFDVDEGENETLCGPNIDSSREEDPMKLPQQQTEDIHDSSKSNQFHDVVGHLFTEIGRLRDAFIEMEYRNDMLHNDLQNMEQDSKKREVDITTKSLNEIIQLSRASLVQIKAVSRNESIRRDTEFQEKARELSEMTGIKLNNMAVAIDSLKKDSKTNELVQLNPVSNEPKNDQAVYSIDESVEAEYRRVREKAEAAAKEHARAINQRITAKEMERARKQALADAKESAKSQAFVWADEDEEDWKNYECTLSTEENAGEMAEQEEKEKQDVGRDGNKADEQKRGPKYEDEVQNFWSPETQVSVINEVIVDSAMAQRYNELDQPPPEADNYDNIYPYSTAEEFSTEHFLPLDTNNPEPFHQPYSQMDLPPQQYHQHPSYPYSQPQTIHYFVPFLSPQ